jgi:tocopherol O-methyltransferase
VTGITISPRQVEIARASARNSSLDGAAKFCLADIEEIDLPGSAFDVIWTMESSEHFRDKPCYLRNAATALKPGGKLLLATWTGCMRSPRMRDVADMFLCPNLQTADDYVRQLQAAGLALVDQQDLTDQVVNTWEICRSRIEPLMDNLGWLPEPARKFVAGINTIQQAYSSGDLSYSILVARK